MKFKIKKHLDYGQALYIAGSSPQLGEWKLADAFRLKWTEKDIWMGELHSCSTESCLVQYKYLIGDWEGLKENSVVWEDGKHNRLMPIKEWNKDRVVEDKWNMEKVCLNLMVPKTQDYYSCYSVIGNYIELGNWKQKVVLHKAIQLHEQKVGEIDTDEEIWDDYNIYFYNFEIYRGRESFRYYYIRENGYLCEPERHPGRLFIFGKQNQHHPNHVKTIYKLGKVQIYEKCDFNLLNFSKITNKIFLGAYPKSKNDLITLKECGVQAILSIQSTEDYKRHSIDVEEFFTTTKQMAIQIESYSIKDMDKEEFYQKAQGALEILKKWEKKQFIIYVHCSAGIYRSPQVLILHLIINHGMKLEEAYSLVKQKHPYVNPNIELVSSIQEKLSSQSLGQKKSHPQFLKRFPKIEEVEEEDQESFQHH